MHRHLVYNAIISVIQVIVSSLTLFFIYKYLIVYVGIEQLGVWSIIIAMTSATGVGGLGLGGSVVKFVSRYLAHKDESKAALVIETAFLSIGFMIGIFALSTYFPLQWLLIYLLPEASVDVASNLLPLMLLSFWLISLGDVFLSGLYGCQRIDLRGMAMIVALFVNAIVVFILVPQLGLLGVAIGRIVQSILLLLFGLVFLNRQLPKLSLFPTHWDPAIFREMIGYGVNFQLITLVQMFMDPLTKALLSKFGGLSAVGYFELANRLVIQVRSVIVSANQVIVPVVSQQHEIKPEHTISTYIKTYRLMLFVSIPVYIAIMAIIPLISDLWIGYYEHSYVVYSVIIIIAWFVNTLSAPAYFTYLGTGNLRWNVISHLTMGVLNLSLGFFLGIYFGGLGVIVAWSVSLLLGSLIVLVSFLVKNKISLFNIFPLENIATLLSGIIAIILVWNIFYHFENSINIWLLTVLSCGLFSLIIILPVFKHPVRHIVFRQLFSWIKK